MEDKIILLVLATFAFDVTKANEESCTLYPLLKSDGN